MTKFEDRGQLQNAIRGFDIGVEKTIDVQDFGRTDRYKAIVNERTGKIECVASNRYKLVQHAEVFNIFTEAVENLGLSVNGLIRNQGGKVKIDMMFKDKVIMPDDGKQIQLGIRMTNSLNLTSSIRAELIAYRLVCSNGMVIGTTIKGCTYARNHMKNLMVAEDLQKFINKAIDKSDEFQSLVNKAIVDTYEWQAVEVLFGELIKSANHREALIKLLNLAQINKKGKLSRWDIYNVLTHYISVEPLKNCVINQLELISKKILQKPLLIAEINE